MNKRNFVLAAAAVASLALGSTAAWAQAYPSKPIRIVVPFPAGGTSDVLARLVGQTMSERFGQPEDHGRFADAALRVHHSNDVCSFGHVFQSVDGPARLANVRPLPCIHCTPAPAAALASRLAVYLRYFADIGRPPN
jgi:hypothetical protein